MPQGKASLMQLVTLTQAAKMVRAKGSEKQMGTAGVRYQVESGRIPVAAEGLKFDKRYEEPLVVPLIRVRDLADAAHELGWTFRMRGWR